MRISPWHRCECGKLHVLTHAFWLSCVCSCGRSLRVTPNGGRMEDDDE